MTFAQAVVAASGTQVGPTNGGAAPVPDNCHTILITNPSATLTLLVGIGVPVVAALTPGTTAQRIGPGQTLTLAVGTLPLRGFIDPVLLAASGLRFDSIGGALTGEITYLNQMGPLT